MPHTENPTMRLFLSRIHFPVTTLGPGRRVGIWFQGCSIRCPGCTSVDTWPHGIGETSVAHIMATISPWLAEADGITISGGEPFDQLPALEALLVVLRSEIGTRKDILLYSGRHWENIAPHILNRPAIVDVVISEPFLESAPQSLAWRGSDNQTMHLLTDLGKSLYTPWLDAPRSALPRAMDVFLDGDELWMAGIPEPGTLDAIHHALADAGFASSTTQAAPRRPAPHPLPT